MITILVATIKGGSGKTTISVNLAGALAAGGSAVALADRDRQRSSLEWLARRPKGATPIRGLDWSKGVGEMPGRVDYLVIDAQPALRGKDVEELVRLADKVVVPVVPSAFDIAATKRFLARLDELRPVSKGKIPVAVVANRVRTGTRAGERLSAYLDDADLRVVARLRDAQAYLDVAETGISLFERGGKRHGALVAEWASLLEFVTGR